MRSIATSLALAMLKRALPDDVDVRDRPAGKHPPPLGHSFLPRRQAVGCRPCATRRTRHIEDETKQGLAPDLALITGDLAFTGKKQEYEPAQGWLQSLWPVLSAESVYDGSPYANAFDWINLCPPSGRGAPKRECLHFRAWIKGEWTPDRNQPGADHSGMVEVPLAPPQAPRLKPDTRGDRVPDIRSAYLDWLPERYSQLYPGSTRDTRLNSGHPVFGSTRDTQFWLTTPAIVRGSVGNALAREDLNARRQD